MIDGRNGDEWNVVARVVVLSHLLPERRRSIKPTPRKHRSTTGGVGAAAPWSEYKRRCNAGGRAGGGRARGGPSGRGDMALAIRGLGAKSLEVPIAAVATSTLVLFSDVVRDMDKALHKGWISRQRNLFQKGSGTTKDGRLSFRFISSSSCEPLATLGGGGRRLSNFQASHLIVQQAEPVGRTESWRRRQQGVASRASDEMDWATYRCPRGKSHSALWISSTETGSSWRQVFAWVYFPASLQSWLPSLITTMGRAGRTHEALKSR